MRLKFVFLITLIFAFFSSRAISADVDDKLFSCRDPELGIRFQCSPKWKIVFNEHTDIFVISEDPEVVLTVSRQPTSLTSLSELISGRLEDFGQYADGFKWEFVSINGIDAVKVKAFDKNTDDMRLTDIYLIRQGYLYKILFSVAPKNAWGSYQFLLKDILDEFTFIEQEIALD